ncbi:2-keto-4-pentenoate hydratase [Mycobacteroides immunogenum]|uniref:2-keto-4-pentenoate hydratase n=1 Tax=Mycobacteroides immunogenum TaxID=83262 RepID=A0A7V8LM22_9MYCO|nr:fumarylacetoacetate hydrolase family protein [Mycobacteroides immunogenum]AMT71196.1 2-keto-4-pentenoate hydratase [Mycobacteroides immunogenum]ANO04302.1 2-keto-4-pentenoate hydratase [Mycobacteroides immunogenum]KIU38460.1 2-keto-4-pentenoate hydratase [Mycobacteroides immunogenum]KPG05086.1 2-keto-4-pentenoate hydratase [Mycobacteroides immunogenum]KPG06661.1 2-keto-4-pentenoate hydratase [Mycobacteroides immunogenum]
MNAEAAGIRSSAAKLWSAQHDRAPIAPLTTTYPDLDVASAYAIQQINLGRHLEAGASLVGRKIGLTSTPMQTLLGVNEPDFGFILDQMVITSGTVEAGQFCAPRVEPEVAFLLRTALRGPGITVADVYAATAAVAVALEIVDSRIADWKLTLPDTVADNASSGAVVLGHWQPYTDQLALPNATASLTLNSIEIDSGAGSAVMGDPAAAVAWLANSLADYDTELSAGQFVMSGSFTSAAFVHSGDVAAATITGLGSVCLAFT